MRPLAAALSLAVMTSGCLAGGPLTGEPSPPFSLLTSEGILVNETTYLGKWVVLDLMATWCGPCRLEVAHLREVQRVHGDDVVILSVGTDRSETMQDLESFGAEYGATWPYALDRDGSVREAMRMKIIPKLVILDPQGRVAFEREGEVLPAAITRVIDPSAAPPPGLPFALGMAGLGLGFLAALNPYRRAHKDGVGGGPSLATLGLFAALGMLAWSFSGIVSTRATYGSLFIGGLTLAAALWWWRARHRAKSEEGSAFQRGSDRTTEMAPHFVGALVLGLTTTGIAAFFAPILGFLAGAAAGLATRARMPARWQERVGWVGLVVVGTGLVAFGARILSP